MIENNEDSIGENVAFIIFVIAIFVVLNVIFG